MKRPLIGKVFLLILLIFLLAACSPASGLLPVNDSRIINNGSSFGQTFTAQYRGLSSISILLAPISSQGSGSLIFHLRSSSQSIDDLANARLPLSEITHQTYYKFDFPPINDSQKKDYFLLVNVEGEGHVQIYTATADSYLDGSLYENQVPQDAQLGFQLEYSYKQFLLGLAQLVVQWTGVLIVGLFIFILPGWAIFSALWRGWDELDWCSKLGLSGGLSLAIYPLFLLWTNLIGLHLGPFYAWIPPIVGLLGSIWKNRKYIIQIRSSHKQKISLIHNDKAPPLEIILVDIVFIVILGLIVISRLWVVHSLDIPLFGDSYQHSMITQLIVDHSGLFDSWAPYADLVTFTYHFGFHSTVAAFHWITGISVEKAMLWAGQLINIIAIMGLYPLAFKITKNRWAGIIAMLVAGLLSPMPMSYVNWGRYTQLTGQAVLPAVIWSAWSLLEKPFPPLTNISWIRKLANLRYLSFDLSSIAIVWISLGGLALTHYRILILTILFFPAFALFTLNRASFMSLLSRIAWIGIGGAILFAPWFIHVFGGKIMSIFATIITTRPSTISTDLELFNGVGKLQTYLPTYIWIAFLLCAGWGLLKHKKDISIFILWWLLIILATNPNWIGLPGAGAITNFAILIAFYIPASITIGSAVEWISLIKWQSDTLDNLINRSKRITMVATILGFIIVCTLGLWGVTKRIKDLNIQTYTLVTRPDIRAMAWIQANTAPDSKFLINSFTANGNTAVVGSDAGWWLPLLALRHDTVPPLTYTAEQGITPDYGQEVMEFYNQIKQKGISNAGNLELLRQEGIYYIYIGQRQGRVNNPNPSLLDPTIINEDPHFNLVYHQDRVWIFKLIQ